MHRGHGEALTVLLLWGTAAVEYDLSHLLAEVGVEEAVDDGVDASGGHGQQVAEGEQEVVVADRQSLQVPVCQHVEDGEREPAESEGCYESDQHDVDSTAVGHALALRGPGTVQHVFAVTKAHENPDITEQYQQKRAEVLEQQEPGGVGHPVLWRGPVLHTGLHVGGSGHVREERAVQIQRHGRVGGILRWRSVEINMGRHLMEWQDQIVIRLICEQLKGQERCGGEAGKNPNENDHHVGLRNAWLPPGGVDDELMSFQSDEHQRQHGNGHRNTLDEWHQAAQQRPKHPVVHEGVNDGEGEAEDTHQNIREREIADENAGDVDFLPAMGDDADEADVPHQPQQHGDAVPQHQTCREHGGHVALLVVLEDGKVCDELGPVLEPVLNRPNTCAFLLPLQRKWRGGGVGEQRRC